MSVHFKQVSGSRVEAGGGAGIKAAPSPKAQMITEAREFWERRAVRPLHNEDAREIVENVTGFFDLLYKWDKEARAKAGD